MDEAAPNHDRGLAFDLATLSDIRQRIIPSQTIGGRQLMDRRRVIKLIGSAGLGAGLLAVLGCGDDNEPAAQQTTQASSATPAPIQRLPPPPRRPPPQTRPATPSPRRRPGPSPAMGQMGR